ncbi:hypothetical protein FGB62_149g023 [Gracilaria domingensis]|nr:hypothetical protein FGB62_149g023 [Gracilaria domingensis]
MNGDYLLCDAESIQEQYLLRQQSKPEIPTSSSDEAEEEGHTSLTPNHHRVLRSTPPQESATHSERKLNALRHFQCYKSECTCSSQFGFECDEVLAIPFSIFDQVTRRNAVPAMLLALTAPRDSPNELMRNPARYARKRKDLRRQGTAEARIIVRCIPEEPHQWLPKY